MEYLVINKIRDKEIIFSNKIIDYKLLWKGHKLSISNNHYILKSLIRIQEYKNSKKILSLDYKKWNQIFLMREVTYKDDCWNDIENYGLDKTYKDILEIMTNNFGYFNKLFIYEK